MLGAERHDKAEGKGQYDMPPVGPWVQGRPFLHNKPKGYAENHSKEKEPNNF